MSRFIPFVFLFCPGISTAQDIWLTHPDEAFELARETGKPVMMVFSGSDWCAPCIKLRLEVWESATFQEFADSNLILLNLDFPRKKKLQPPADMAQINAEMADRWNPNGEFPLVLLLTPEEEIIGRTGYRPGGAEQYISHLESILSTNETQP